VTQYLATTSKLPKRATIFLCVQGVIKAYDPSSGDGVVIRDTDLSEYNIATDALEGSIFRMLRQGQRVLFSLNDAGCATKIRFGSERDMETPGA
jgi:cold shock CspA family protein